MDERDENIDEVKILDTNEDKCNSCILHIVLFSILFTINVGIGAYFAYFHKILLVKQQFIKYNFIELINGRSQTN